MEISIAELWPPDPPLTRVRLKTSPSLVIAIIEGSAFSALSASAKSLTATIPASNLSIASPRSVAVTSEASAVKPAGMRAVVAPEFDPSITKSSD